MSMYTRGAVTHAYAPLGCSQVNMAGAMRVVTLNGFPQTWAIARPVVAPSSNGAPTYVNNYPAGTVARGGVQPLTPARPHVEMDPSNPKTWQRPYQFTK